MVLKVAAPGHLAGAGQFGKVSRARPCSTRSRVLTLSCRREADGETGQAETQIRLVYLKDLSGKTWRGNESGRDCWQGAQLVTWPGNGQGQRRQQEEPETVD